MKTIQQVIKDNEMIAEFMGYKQEDELFKGFKMYVIENQYNNGSFSHNGFDMKYHCKWDWLMKVVEEIEERTPCKINILECECEIYSMVSDGFITSKNSVIYKSRDTKIEAVYEAVIEFIKWYNDHIA